MAGLTVKYVSGGSQTSLFLSWCPSMFATSQFYYDGHDSHETVDMKQFAFDMNVILIAFP